MFDITKLIHRIPNAIPENICKRYIDYFENNIQQSYYESSTEAITQEELQASFLAYEIKPRNEYFNFVRNITHKAINSYTKYLFSSGNFHKSFRNVLRYSHKYRILKYRKGAKIHAHIDHMPYTYASIVINLNEDYTGGEFSFFNGKYDLNLKQGEILLFPADFFWVHEVKPVIEGSRYSINSFIGSLPYDIRNEVTDIGNEKEEKFLKNTEPSDILGPYDLVE